MLLSLPCHARVFMKLFMFFYAKARKRLAKGFFLR